MADFKAPNKIAVRAVKALGTQLQLAQFARNVFVLTVENTVAQSDILKPIFWTHIAEKLKKGDRVEVTPEDGSWYAEFMIVSSSSNWAKVVPLRVIQIDSDYVSAKALDEYYVKWASKALGFRVHRRGDGQVVKDKFETAESANTWIQTIQESAAKELEVAK